MMLPDALQCYNWARDSRVFRANINQIVYRTAEQTDDDDDAWRSIQQSSSLGKLRTLSVSLPEREENLRWLWVCLPKSEVPRWRWFSGTHVGEERERAELMIHEWMLPENPMLLFAGAIAACRMQKYFDGIALIAWNCFAPSSELRFWGLYGSDLFFREFLAWKLKFCWRYEFSAQKLKFYWKNNV